MDRAERELFARSVGGAVERRAGPALDDALDELGWTDALASDTRDAVSVLFELQGRHCATSSAIDRVLVDALGVSGSGLVLPALGDWRPAASWDGDALHVDGLAVRQVDSYLVVAHIDDKDVAADIAASDLDVREVHGIDPSHGLRRVQGTTLAPARQPVDWSTAVRAGQRALAHELLGASRAMLELAREHALERIQFGRPIATFQAVRHRLADTRLAIETADAALESAWLDDSPSTASMAKALAGRSARTAARHCQQVLAGIGFTTEHPLHNYIRRTLVLDQLLGSSKRLTKALGDELLATKRLPPVLPL